MLIASHWIERFRLRYVPLRANKNSKEKQTNFLRRRKTRAIKSSMVLFFNLIVSESGVSFLEQSR